MRPDPDIAALAARLGLTKFTYRTFARPAFTVEPPASPAAAPPPPADDPIILVEAVVERPEPPPPVSDAPVPEALHARDQYRPAPPVLPAETTPRFTLLEQALAGGRAASVPASAHPFLDLRRALAGPPDPAER